MEVHGMHGLQPHQRHTVHQHQQRAVNTDVIADTKIHEHRVCQKIVHQQPWYDILYELCFMVDLPVLEEVMEYQTEQ